LSPEALSEGGDLVEILQVGLYTIGYVYDSGMNYEKETVEEPPRWQG